MYPKTLTFFTLLSLSLINAAIEDAKYYRTPPPPRILSHKQTQLHDGAFKFAFAAENGLAQTEVIAPDGTRNGGYTYVDPHGKTVSVKYTAGKDGFRILEGDHIPREVAAHPNDHPAAVPYHEHDDGSYKPERDEHPYTNQQSSQSKYQPPVYQPAQQQEYQPRHQQYQPQQLQLQYKQNILTQPHYVKSYVPQAQAAHPVAQPRFYDERYSNAVDSDEGKQPVYNDAPGHPNSFGVGYAFSFQN